MMRPLVSTSSVATSSAICTGFCSGTRTVESMSMSSVSALIRASEIERLQHLERVGEVVLAGVDVVESEIARDAYEVQHVGEAPHHVRVARVLEEPGEGESEFHGVVPTAPRSPGRLAQMRR